MALFCGAGFLNPRRFTTALVMLGCWILGVVVGVAAASYGTESGRIVLGKTLRDVANSAVNGSVTIGEIFGSLLGGVGARDIVVRDEDGAVFAEISQLQLAYGLRDILGGRIAMGRLTLTSPNVYIIDRPGRRLNIEELLGLGGPPGDNSTGPLISFRDVQIIDATVTIMSPAERGDTTIHEAKETADGYMRIRRIDDLYARFPYVRISSPFRGEEAVQIDIARLSAAVSDPKLQIGFARGRVEILGDTIALSMEQVQLPGSRAEVTGSLVVTNGKVHPNLDVRSEQLNTDDVIGLVSQVPAGMTASGSIVISSPVEGVMEFYGEPFAIEGLGGGGEARGRLAMKLGPEDEWAFEDTRLDLEDFDLEYIRSFFDTLPLAGRVTGYFEANGPKEELSIGLNVTFLDSLIEGWPATVIDGAGIVSLGGSGEVVFRDYQLQNASIDMATVRRILPGIDLQGLLYGTGRLDGPWLQLSFDGDIRHVAVPPLETRANGNIQFDARGDTLGVFADLFFDSLNLDGLRSSYPDLGIGGSFRGTTRVYGYADSLWLDADLEGPAGAVFAEGAVIILPDRKGAHELDMRVARLNLERLAEGLPRTDLFGRVVGSGVSDSPKGPRANANAIFRISSVQGVVLDSVLLNLVIEDSTLRLDTLDSQGRSVHASGAGEIGLWNSRRGTLEVRVETDSIGAIEGILEALLGSVEDVEEREPSGSLVANLRIDGAISDFELTGQVRGSGVSRVPVYMSDVQADGRWKWPQGDVDIGITIDSVELAGLGFTRVVLQAHGGTDSLSWLGRSRFGRQSNEQWIARGELRSTNEQYTVPVSLLGFQLASGSWHARQPLILHASGDGIDFSEAIIASDVGGGSIVVNGRLPFRGEAGLTASLVKLPVSDLWALLQRNYDAVEGEVGGTFSLGGTVEYPTMSLSVSLADARFGDFTAPQLQVTANYRFQRLRGELSARRVGEEVLKVNVELPIDLALKETETRQLPGRVSVLARADSVDLSLLDAITPLVSSLDGTLDANFGIAGTWENPELTGRLSIADGVGRYPAIGVLHENINGSFRLSGDTIWVEQLSLNSGRGSADITGFMRLEELSRPVLDLQFRGRNFHALNVRDFLSLEATGNLTMRGPVFDATLTGQGTITRGVLYFADLIEKQLVSFQDTLLFTESELVDTMAIRREGLGARFENRLYNSLRVDSLRLEMGPDVWMRSSEANIQLRGDLIVNKVRDQYRLNGTLQTPRGTYRLSPGPSLVQLVATREFTVTRGEVTYFGTPDLNAGLDIEARHEVHSVRGEDITAIVHIGGTLYDPRLRFSSDAQPPISETEILSYLFFGAPSVEAFAGAGQGAYGDQRLVQQGLAQFLEAVSGQLEYSVISDLNVPLDYVQIRPSIYRNELAGVDVAVGKRLGEKWFVTLSPRICTTAGESVFASEGLDVGASLEYRFTKQWLFLVSGDPVQSCVPFGSYRLAPKYQLGVDLLWEKRY
jgi:translocation and assembly module TamB